MLHDEWELVPEADKKLADPLKVYKVVESPWGQLVLSLYQGEHVALRGAISEVAFDFLKETERSMSQFLFETFRQDRLSVGADRSFDYVSATKAATGHDNPPGEVLYEWCHLIGNGDGGSMRAENLVAGTYAVNTEQLAIEEVTRTFREKLIAKNPDYTLGILSQAVLGPPMAAEAAPTPAVHQASHHVAELISYHVILFTPAVGFAPPTPIPVYRHLMDAKRGLMTRSEVKMLRSVLSRDLERTLAQVPAAGSTT